ncbi:hypothetical protein A2U01_0102683, partial [Trifolium medium]|nr:hypothetical protein [Trifolium medium]
MTFPAETRVPRSPARAPLSKQQEKVKNSIRFAQDAAPWALGAALQQHFLGLQQH